MKDQTKTNRSRRDFLKTTGFIAAGAMLSTAGTPLVHGKESERVLKIAAIGCGGRGRGAITQALEADPKVVLWSVSDAFEDRSNAGVNQAKAAMQASNTPEKVDVADERKFFGLDSYKKAMDALEPGDVVLLCTPPAFRPLHYAYAVEKNLNIFAEKPVAVDIPGLKKLQEANKIALDKGLKVGVGLNNRHYDRTAETIKAIHDGKIGDVIGSFVYRCENAHGFRGGKDQNPLEVQLRHIFCFNWTSGGFIVDALIHNLDICCWAMGSLPVAAQGQGGRLLRKAQDQLIDHAAIDYRFADGRRLTMYTQTIPNCWHNFEAVIHGTKGSAVLGEGVGEPKFFEDYNANRNNNRGVVWKASSPGNNSYQTEHDRLFKAIRENKAWNEMEIGIDATFTPILGRMALESGKMVTAEEAWKSTTEQCPNIENLSFDGPFPLVPNENGDYPQPIPGVTKI